MLQSHFDLSLLRNITIGSPSVRSFLITEDEDCAICRLQLSDCSLVARHNICRHTFCAPCMQQWASTLIYNRPDGPQAITCPICRAVLMPARVLLQLQPVSHRLNTRQVIGELSSIVQQHAQFRPTTERTSATDPGIWDHSQRSYSQNLLVHDARLHHELRTQMPIEMRIIEGRLGSERAPQTGSPRSPTLRGSRISTEIETTTIVEQPLYFEELAGTAHETGVAADVARLMSRIHADEYEEYLLYLEDDDNSDHQEIEGSDENAQVEVAGVRLGSDENVRQLWRDLDDIHGENTMEEADREGLDWRIDGGTQTRDPGTEAGEDNKETRPFLVNEEASVE